jgi:hypothetical protein
VLTAYERGEATKVVTRQLGPALAFERLWQETGCRRVIGELAGERDSHRRSQEGVMCAQE